MAFNIWYIDDDYAPARFSGDNRGNRHAVLPEAMSPAGKVMK